MIARYIKLKNNIVGTGMKPVCRKWPPGTDDGRLRIGITEARQEIRQHMYMVANRGEVVWNTKYGLTVVK